MSDLIYRVQEYNAEGSNVVQNTKYHALPSVALKDLISNLWVGTPHASRWLGRKVLTPFLEEGLVLDPNELSATLDGFAASMEDLWQANPKFSQADSKRVVQHWAKSLKAIDVTAAEYLPAKPSSEMVVKVDAHKKKGYYSNPLAIVKGIINNSDHMNSITVLSPNETFLPNRAQIERLFHEIVEGAKHVKRWNPDGSRIYSQTYEPIEADNKMAAEEVKKLNALLEG